MSSEENKINYISNGQSEIYNEKIKNNNDEDKSFNNDLIKPIPINPKFIKNQKNDLSTMGNSSVSVNNINHNSQIPIIYSKMTYAKQISKNISLEDNNLNYNSKNSKNEEKINNFPNLKEKVCCNCTKTKCIKKYCECFANNRFCDNCNCQDCMNKINYLDNNNMKNKNENEIIICTCTKSNCNKKYCECYKSGMKCNEKCRCINCMNTLNQNQLIINNSITNNNNDNNNKVNINHNENNNNNNNINNKLEKNINNKDNKKNNLEDKKGMSKENIIYEDSDNEFKIQRISVFINRNQTLINVEKFSKEEMSLLCKKRNHNWIIIKKSH